MMTQRRVVTLLIVAAAIIVVALIVASRPYRDAETAAGTPILAGLKENLNDVTEVRIAKGDGTHVTLRKQPKAWQVVERGYPADSGKIRKLLLDLAALEVVEEKTSDPANYARIGVEDVKSAKSTGTHVEAVTPKKTYGLIVGRFSGMKSTYVRVSGEAQSYLATPQIMPEASPKLWLDRTVMDVPESRIREVAVEPESGRAYTVSREKKDQTNFTVSNIPKGRELLSPGAADGVAGELASFTADDVRKMPDGAKPTDRVTFRTFDGLEIEIAGQKEGDTRYVSFTARSTAKETASEAQTLAARTNGWQYEIPGYKYDLLFKPLEDLLKKPESKKTSSKKDS